MNQWIAALGATTIKFGCVNVCDKRNAKVFLGENTRFVGEPVVCMDEVWLEFHKISLDKLAVVVLNVANRHELFAMIDGKTLFLDVFIVVSATAVTEERIDMERR